MALLEDILRGFIWSKAQIQQAKVQYKYKYQVSGTGTYSVEK